jgi:hypothetical protein
MILLDVFVSVTVAFVISLIIAILMDSYTNYKKYMLSVRNSDSESDSSTPNNPILSRILFTRNFAASSNPNVNNDVTDALLDYISNIDTVSQLKYTSFYIMDTQEEFVIQKNRGITGIVNKLVSEETTGSIKLLSFYIQSTALSITELREWVTEVHSEYTVNKNNELGSRRYFFNQLPDTQGRGEKKWKLKFDMTPFETTKTLNNLYGEHIDRVQSRIELFNNKQWYQSKGVPHTLGILLHGEPGCGKTSLIKSIANDTNRHVFNIRLSDNMTKEQLNSLFFDTKVQVRNKDNDTTSVINIPLNQRLYVLEDIDCAENTVLSRTDAKPVREKSSARKIPDFAEGMFGDREFEMLHDQIHKEKEERIDLAFLLNILDGILETPQRLIIMTTNYPNKLDHALLRPGRIDLILEFKKCSVDMLTTMVDNFYLSDVNVSSLQDERLNEVLSPAEVQEVLCNYIDDDDGAVFQIRQMALSKLSVPLAPSISDKVPLSVNHEGTERPHGNGSPPGATCLSERLEDSTAAGIPFLVEESKGVEESKDGDRCTGDNADNANLGCVEGYKAGECVANQVMPSSDATPVQRRNPDWLKFHM